MRKKISSIAGATFLSFALIGGIAPATAGNGGIDVGGSTIENGSALTIKNGSTVVGTCSATVTNKSYVLTAGHCGTKGLVVEYQGDRIGVISATAMGNGYDLAKITLDKGVRTKVTRVNENYQPKKGDAVEKYGFVSVHTKGKVSDPNIITTDSNESIKKPLDGPVVKVKVWTADLVSVKGDSGGAVIKDGAVVGLVKGGKDSNTTTVTPLGPALKALK